MLFTISKWLVLQMHLVTLPAAFDNSVSAYTALKIKDCGTNTKIRGGTVEPNDACSPQISILRTNT